jgi:hypothetical protein
MGKMTWRWSVPGMGKQARNWRLAAYLAGGGERRPGGGDDGEEENRHEQEVRLLHGKHGSFVQTSECTWGSSGVVRVTTGRGPRFK